MFAVLKEHQKRLLQKSKKKVCSFSEIYKKQRKKEFYSFLRKIWNYEFLTLFGKMTNLLFKKLAERSEAKKAWSEASRQKLIFSNIFFDAKLRFALLAFLSWFIFSKIQLNNKFVIFAARVNSELPFLWSNQVHRSQNYFILWKLDFRFFLTTAQNSCAFFF